MSAYRHNTAVDTETKRHLIGCVFDPPLAGYLDVDAYAAKLVARAERFECWEDDELIGLVAIYCNDERSRRGFITNVSVSPGHTGRGIGRTLVEQAIAHCAEHGFTRIELDVRDGNAAAGLYRRLGFDVIGSDAEQLRMRLELEPIPG